MITNKMKRWLQKTNRPYEGLYMQRIQNQIDKNLENALWLAKNFPEILLNEYGKGDQPRHERYQKLLLLITILKPHYQILITEAKDIEKLYREALETK